MDEENRLRATNCLHVLSRIVPVLLEYRYALLSSARVRAWCDAAPRSSSAAFLEPMCNRCAGQTVRLKAQGRSTCVSCSSARRCDRFAL